MSEFINPTVSNEIRQRCTKTKIALRHLLLGAGYNQAAGALTLVERLTAGKTRKDGVTPELQHMIDVTLAVWNVLNHVPENKKFNELVLIAALLHDVGEDIGMLDTIRARYLNIVHQMVIWLSKKTVDALNPQSKIPVPLYLERMVNASVANDDMQDYAIAACVIKCCDRMCNISTMIGGFTVDGINRYTEETKTLFFDFMKHTISVCDPVLFNASTLQMMYGHMKQTTANAAVVGTLLSNWFGLDDNTPRTKPLFMIMPSMVNNMHETYYGVTHVETTP